MKESSICQIVEGTEFTKSSRGESGMRTLQISAKHSFPVEAMAKLLTRRAILLCDVLLWPWPSKFSVLRKNATLTEAKPVAKSEAKSGPRDMKMQLRSAEIISNYDIMDLVFNIKCQHCK